MTFQSLISKLRNAAAADNDRDVRIDSDVKVLMGKIAQIVDHLHIYS